MSDVKEGTRAAGATYGSAPDAAHAVQHRDGTDAPALLAGVPARKSWLGGAARVVRNAAIAVVILTMLPVGLVATRGHDIWRYVSFANSRTKASIAERVRPFALPRDPSITEQRANEALASLVPAPKDPVRKFQMIEPAHRMAAPWDSLVLGAGMFLSARPNVYSGPSVDVIKAAPRGFSPAELAYLGAIARAPLWHEVDVLARAPRIDPVAARIKLPFPSDASWEDYPIMSMRGMREISYATAARAAWFMANKQPDSAETVIKSLIALGFNLIDNSSTRIDELVGDVLVGAGRDELRNFYTAMKNPLAQSPGLQVSTKAPPDNAPWPVSEQRQWLIDRTIDPTISRGERIESMRALNYASCSNVKELMLGPSEDIRTAMATARRNFAHTASDRALMDLAQRFPRVGLRELSYSPSSTLVGSAAAVPAALLQNDRLVMCTLVASASFIGP